MATVTSGVDEEVVVAFVVDVVVAAATGNVVVVVSEPSRGQSTQTPTAKPTTIRPAMSRFPILDTNLRHHERRMKGSRSGRENLP